MAPYHTSKLALNLRHAYLHTPSTRCRYLILGPDLSPLPDVDRWGRYVRKLYERRAPAIRQARLYKGRVLDLLHWTLV